MSNTLKTIPNNWAVSKVGVGLIVLAAGLSASLWSITAQATVVADKSEPALMHRLQLKLTGSTNEWGRPTKTERVQEVSANDTDGDGIPNVDDPDDDNDGMPDTYEIAHGLNPLFFGDALLDKDGDGYLNLNEALSGSAADDAGSIPSTEFDATTSGHWYLISGLGVSYRKSHAAIIDIDLTKGTAHFSTKYSRNFFDHNSYAADGNWQLLNHAGNVNFGIGKLLSSNSVIHKDTNGTYVEMVEELRLKSLHFFQNTEQNGTKHWFVVQELVYTYPNGELPDLPLIEVDDSSVNSANDFGPLNISSGQYVLPLYNFQYSKLLPGILDLQPGGAGNDAVSNRSFSWALDASGGLNIDYTDGSTLELRALESFTPATNVLFHYIDSAGFEITTTKLLVPKSKILSLALPARIEFNPGHPENHNAVGLSLNTAVAWLFNSDGTGGSQFWQNNAWTDPTKIVYSWSTSGAVIHSVYYLDLDTFNYSTSCGDLLNCIKVLSRDITIDKIVDNRYYLHVVEQVDANLDGVIDDTIPAEQPSGYIDVFVASEKDVDRDSLPDAYEDQNGLDKLNPGDGLEDTDQDGLVNWQEYEAGTDPNNADSDSDGAKDGTDAFPLDASEQLDTDNDGIGNNADLDDDNDGMPDAWEIRYGLDPLDAADASLDADGDGVSNLAEFTQGTDPTVSDVPPVSTGGGGGSFGFTMLGLLLIVSRRRAR